MTYSWQVALPYTWRSRQTLTTVYQLTLKIWKFIFNPQIFVPWIHSVFRVVQCSFSWMKLLHNSEHPHRCGVYDFSTYTSQVLGNPPLCLLMLRQASHITGLKAPTLWPFTSSWRDALPYTWSRQTLTIVYLLTSHQTNPFTKYYYIYIHQV